MLSITNLPSYGPEQIGRWKPITAGAGARDGMAVLAIFVSGILAACAIAFLHFRGLGLPGHFIIKAALPMMIGFSLVPRRFVGTVMGIVAGFTMLGFKSASVGHFEPAAVTALLAFGPMIDVAMIGKPTSGWKLYLRCAFAGLLTNLVALAIKWAGPMMLINGLEGRGGRALDARMFIIFAACGIVAGLLSAAICLRQRSDSRKNTKLASAEQFSASSESVA